MTTEKEEVMSIKEIDRTFGDDNLKDDFLIKCLDPEKMTSQEADEFIHKNAKLIGFEF